MSPTTRSTSIPPRITGGSCRPVIRWRSPTRSRSCKRKPCAFRRHLRTQFADCTFTGQGWSGPTISLWRALPVRPESERGAKDMPRTVLTPVAAVRGGGVTLGAGTSAAAAATGMIVASPGAYKLMIQVANASISTMYVIFRAGGYQGTPAGAVNAGYLTDQYQPFAGASSGDLSVPVTSNATVLVTDLDTGRYS